MVCLLLVGEEVPPEDQSAALGAIRAQPFSLASLLSWFGAGVLYPQKKHKLQCGFMVVQTRGNTEGRRGVVHLITLGTPMLPSYGSTRLFLGTALA